MLSREVQRQESSFTNFQRNAMLVRRKLLTAAIACALHRSRSEARTKAAAHLAAGNAAAALECYQRAVDVTPSMARQVGGGSAG